MAQTPHRHRRDTAQTQHRHSTDGTRVREVIEVGGIRGLCDRGGGGEGGLSAAVDMLEAGHFPAIHLARVCRDVPDGVDTISARTPEDASERVRE